MGKKSDDKPECPECHSANVVPIIYGLPSKETVKEAERGKFILGGCCISDESPRWHCRDCQHKWGRLGDK